MTCYALVCGPKQSGKPRWVPAIIQKVLGAHSAMVRILGGQIWRRHMDQLRPRHGDMSESRDSCGTTLGNEVNQGNAVLII